MSLNIHSININKLVTDLSTISYSEFNFILILKLNPARQKLVAKNNVPIINKDQLGCVVCGCIEIRAPMVGGVSDVEIDVSTQW